MFASMTCKGGGAGGGIHPTSDLIKWISKHVGMLVPHRAPLGTHPIRHLPLGTNPIRDLPLGTQLRHRRGRYLGG